MNVYFVQSFAYQFSFDAEIAGHETNHVGTLIRVKQFIYSRNEQDSPGMDFPSELHSKVMALTSEEVS